MKSPFLLPLYLVSVFLLFLLGLVAVSMLWSWIVWAPHGLRIAARAVMDRSVPIVASCLPVALIPAMLFTGLRVARNPISRPFSLLLPLATAFCILYFGPMGLRALPAAEPAAPPSGTAGHLRAGVFLGTTDISAGRTVLHAGMVVPENASAALADVVVSRTGGAPPRLSFHRGAKATLEGEEIVVRVAAEVYRLPARSIYRDLVEPSVSTRGLLADLEFLNRELDRPAGQTSAILAAAGVTAFFWFSCFLLRTTRWPLLSVVLLGLAWRGALVAIRFLATVVRPGLADLLSGSGAGAAIAGETVSLSLLAAGLGFLAVDLLFVRFDFWKRELEE